MSNRDALVPIVAGNAAATAAGAGLLLGLSVPIAVVDPAAIAGLGPVAGGPGGPRRDGRPIRPRRDEREGDP